MLLWHKYRPKVRRRPGRYLKQPLGQATTATQWISCGHVDITQLSEGKSKHNKLYSKPNAHGLSPSQRDARNNNDKLSSHLQQFAHPQPNTHQDQQQIALFDKEILSAETNLLRKGPISSPPIIHLCVCGCLGLFSLSVFTLHQPLPSQSKSSLGCTSCPPVSSFQKRKT